jgi:hypothetical protein
LAAYYIDAAAGDDANPGSAEAPWKSYLNIVSYYCGEPNQPPPAWCTSDTPPPQWHRLQPGDTVHFRPGEYSATYRYQDSGDFQGLFLRGAHGTAEAPIRLIGEPGAVLNARAPDGDELRAVYLLQSAHIRIEGFEITGYGRGINVSESDDVVIAHNWIHDVDGIDNNNVAGLEVSSSSQVDVRDNLIHDNFDRTNADTNGRKTENSRNVVLFSNRGPVRFHHNKLLQTPPTTADKTGAGIIVKHGGDGTFEADHNVVVRAWGVSIGSGNADSSVHHNLILDGGPIQFEDFGGRTNLENERIWNNTLVDRAAPEPAGGGLGYHPSNSYTPPGDLTFTGNIVYDTRSYNIDRGVLEIDEYGPDGVYRDVIEGGKLHINHNLYFNPNTALQFNLFNATGGPFGELGCACDWTAWRGLGFDQNSVNADPQFDDSFLAAQPAASGLGWYADDMPRLTVLVVGSDLIGEGETTRAVIVRSGAGVGLAEPLTVTLATSDAGQVAIPGSVTIPAGRANTYFAITGVADGRTDATRAVQIRAVAAGFPQAVGDWVRVQDRSEPPANQPPRIDPPGDRIALAGEPLRVQVAAVDPNGDGLTYSLDPGAPAGAAIDPNSGRFAWTPSPDDVNRTHRIVVRVTDTGSPALSATAAFSVTVSQRNASTTDYRDGVLILPGTPDQSVRLRFDWTERAAEYNNEIGVFAVDVNGAVDGFVPASATFAQAALGSDSRQIVFASGQGAGASRELTFPGGSRLGFYLVQDDTTAHFLTNNRQNVTSRQPVAFFSQTPANPVAFDHVLETDLGSGAWQLAWEDLTGGGDRNFRDAVFTIRPQDGAGDPPADTTPPSVQEVRLLTELRGRRPREVVLGVVVQFSEPMDAVRASNVAAYRLRHQSLLPRAIAIESATYDAASRSVTLRLAQPRRLGLIRLTVRAALLTDLAGHRLDGNGDSREGDNFVHTLNGPP